MKVYLVRVRQLHIRRSKWIPFTVDMLQLNQILRYIRQKHCRVLWDHYRSLRNSKGSSEYLWGVEIELAKLLKIVGDDLIYLCYAELFLHPSLFIVESGRPIFAAVVAAPIWTSKSCWINSWNGQCLFKSNYTNKLPVEGIPDWNKIMEFCVLLPRALILRIACHMLSPGICRSLYWKDLFKNTSDGASGV